MVSVEHLPPKDEMIGILSSLAGYGAATKDAVQIIDVGTAPFLEYFKTELFSDYIEKGGATCRFFEGSAGSGKTHIIRLIENIAAEEGYIVCYIELTANLQFSDWDQITKTILENMYIVRNGQQIKRFPEILSAIKRSPDNHPDALKNLKNVQLSHPSFQNAIQSAINRSITLDKASWEMLRRYLIGEKVRVADFRKHGLKRIKKSVTKNNAEQVLNTVLNAIHYMGLKGTVIIFDETDRSWISQRRPVPRKVQIAANLIRRFIDACSTGEIKGTIAIFAVLPNFIQNCADCYPALGQRLELDRHYLDAISWRWPLLTTNEANEILNKVEDPLVQRQIFLKEAIEKFYHIVEYCGGDLTNLRPELEQRAKKEMEQRAGEEYKRAIIKVLAESSLMRIEKMDGNQRG